MSNTTKKHAWNCSCAICGERRRQHVLAGMEQERAQEAAREAEAEADRQERAILSTYSPRRQWVTPYGAVFVEGIGFIQHAK